MTLILKCGSQVAFVRNKVLPKNDSYPTSCLILPFLHFAKFLSPISLFLPSKQIDMQIMEPNIVQQRKNHTESVQQLIAESHTWICGGAVME